ncbi:MAG: hypothetical protein ACR2F8_01845, partial [Caulobacteraceae bacterium]
VGNDPINGSDPSGLANNQGRLVCEGSAPCPYGVTSAGTWPTDPTTNLTEFIVTGLRYLSAQGRIGVNEILNKFNGGSFTGMSRSLLKMAGHPLDEPLVWYAGSISG